ncbi:ATP synthase F1 subunit delta [symbiont of Argiope bruennichi]|uniref:ATP synthase F1 subunit delta n=1 Tax=symbiont of Argiope bruennichi TaxID=2810479 RepID=UPI003DA307C9
MKQNYNFTAFSMAIFSLYKKNNQLDVLYKEARDFETLLNDKYFFAFLTSYKISKEKTINFISLNLKKYFSKYFLNFIFLIIEKNYFFYIKKINNYLLQLLIEALDIKKIDVYLANNFSDEFIKKIILKELSLKENYIFFKHIDKNLIGGYKIVFENKSYDKTVKSILHKMSDNF